MLVVRVMPVEGAGFEGGGLTEERGEGDAVGIVAGAVGDGGDVEEGRVEVGADRRSVGGAAGTGDAWPVDDQRDADAAFVRRAFAGAQGEVGGRGDAAAIVGG